MSKDEYENTRDCIVLVASLVLLLDIPSFLAEIKRLGVSGSTLILDESQNKCIHIEKLAEAMGAMRQVVVDSINVAIDKEIRSKTPKPTM